MPDDLGIRVDAITLLVPVPGPIVLEFGARPEVFAAQGLADHEGLDYQCPADTPVRAAAAGRVWRSGPTAGPWGTRVILRHTWEKHQGYTVYAHLSAVRVAAGQTVAAGQVIGLSGSTGDAPAPQLHFGLALNVVNEGYACPQSMGAFWWHDPLVWAPVRGLRNIGEEHDGSQDCGLPSRNCGLLSRNCRTAVVGMAGDPE